MGDERNTRVVWGLGWVMVEYGDWDESWGIGGTGRNPGVNVATGRNPGAVWGLGGTLGVLWGRRGTL